MKGGENMKCTNCNKNKPDVKIEGGYRKPEYLEDGYYDFSRPGTEEEFLSDFQNPDTWERITNAYCNECMGIVYAEPDLDDPYYCTY